SMGLWTEKSLATHLLLENAYESNLLPDISRVDYLAGHKERTHLQPLEGLPVFVDDIYVYGYLRKEDCKGRTTGENSSVKRVVARVAWAAHETSGEKYMQTSIVHTLAIREGGGAILSTIARIDSDTDEKAKKAWQGQHPGAEPVGVFVAKVDVSEVLMAGCRPRSPPSKASCWGRAAASTPSTTRRISREPWTGTRSSTTCPNGFREQGDLAEAMQN
ncbi:MAG: hypothetical protein AB2556_25200, partial [Candidatus Thiodiazotropha sp.]